MRPLRLEVEGLTSFAEHTVVDFTDLQLFAITGPTGAGKSSLIDAMLLALFGKVPRVGRENAQLIAHGKDQLVVLFEFEARGERYRVARRIKSKGASDVRVDRVTATGTESLAGKAREAEEHIERILGIDYEAFTHSVVLPQGQFDRFLKGDRKERRAILVNLLGLSLYERMAKVAGERQRELQTKSAAATERLQGDFAAATPERLAQLHSELQSAELAQNELAQREATLADAERAALELRQARTTIAATTSELGKRRSQHADAAAAQQQELQARSAFAADRLNLEQQLQSVTVDPARSAQLARALPYVAQLQRFTAALAQRVQAAAQAAERTARAEQELTRAEAALPQMHATVEERAAELAQAEAALELQQRADAAMHLRGTLHAGEPCPVCEQTIASVPPTKPTNLAAGKSAIARARDDLRAAERQRDDTERAKKQKQKELPELRSGQLAAEQLREQTADELAQVRNELASANVALAEPLDAAALQRTLAAEQQVLQERAQLHAQLAAQLAQLLADQGAREQRLAATSAQIGLLAEQVQQLETALALVNTACEGAEQKFSISLAASGQPPIAAPGRPGEPDEAAHLQQRRKMLVEVTAAVDRKTGELAQQVAQLEDAITKAAQLRQETATLTANAALARELALLLRGDRFLDFVLEAAVQLLTKDGAARLMTLSQGRYSLRHDGNDFLVVDHWNAGRERSVKTLSGGETFLASLALALALAESITALAASSRGGDALECLFLDEGFGALDTDTLEVAVQALEALQGGKRMVGVVTHIQELAERLPARLHVTNSAGVAQVTAG